MKIEPTKTWQDEHKAKPKHCKSTDCFCVIDIFSKNGQGQCVGIVLGRNDLDVLRYCHVSWDEKARSLKEWVIQVMPHEAMGMSMILAWGCAEALRSADPEYRKVAGKMMRARSILLKKAK